MPVDKTINQVIRISHEKGRDYITPEDVSDALKEGIRPTKVRLDVLEVLGSGGGAEDWSLCAFVAWRGTPTPEDEED
jgi:hypothetical protein